MADTLSEVVPSASATQSNARPSGGERTLPSAALLGWACVIGVGGGVLGSVYYFLMSAGLRWVWGAGVGIEVAAAPIHLGFRPMILLVTTLGGLLVGLSLKWLGSPGEIAAVVNNIHMEAGRIDPRQTPSMTVASLLSIVAGGSAGPEAPLVQIIGSLGSWLGDRLRLRGEMVRTLTFCGMGTALGAFFGAPLGGALFALEIPHRRGLEYYEALVPTIVAALAGFFVFRALVGYEGGIFHLEAVAHVSLGTVAMGGVLGIAGGALAMVFVAVFQGMGRFAHRFESHKPVVGLIGGLLIGLSAQVAPLTLFWGEFQIQTLIDHVRGLTDSGGAGWLAMALLGLAGMKMLTIGFTLHGGFRGGFIFPLFFIGAAGGLAISTLAPQVPVTVSVLCMMAAVNVAVTKTPVSTAVIVTSLSGTAILPAIVCATMVSFLLTTRVVLIRSQRRRGAVMADEPWEP